MSPLFKYHARGPGGKVENGKIEAVNQQEAVDKLQTRGLFVVSVAMTNGAENNVLRNNRVIAGAFLSVVIILIGGLCACFLIKEQNEARKIAELKIYKTRLLEVNTRIMTDAYLLLEIAQKVSKKWTNGAIDSSSEFGLGRVITKVRIKEMFEEIKDQIGALRDSNKKILEDLQKLKEYPPQHKDTYSALQELYGAYSRIYTEVLNPSGSLASFNARVNDLKSEFDDKTNKLKLVSP